MGEIVVGVDGSEGSREALRWARDEARRRGSSLRVVSVWQYPVLTTMPAYGVRPPYEEMVRMTREITEAVLAEEGLLPEAEVPLTIDIVEGAAAPALVELSKEAELLVVGSRGHGGFMGLVLGSVSQHCAGRAVCPVVIVPAQDPDDADGDDANGS